MKEHSIKNELPAKTLLVNNKKIIKDKKKWFGRIRTKSFLKNRRDTTQRNDNL